MQRTSRLGLIAYCLGFGLCGAGSIAFAAPLTWEQCVHEVSTTNSELLAAKASVQSSESLLSASKSGLLPSVTANYSYLDTSTAGATQTASAGNLTAGFNLFNGFQDLTKIRTAQANAAVALSQLITTQAKVSYDLKASFAGMIYSQSLIALTQDIIHRRQENLRLVELRYEAGNENKGSVLRSKALLSQAQLEKLQAVNNHKLSQELFAKVLGRDGDNTLEIKGIPPLQPPAEKLDLHALALSTPEHQQAILQEKLSETALATARAQFFPTVALSASVGTQGTDLLMSENSIGQRWSFGVTLSLPLFNGGKDLYTTQSASSLLRAAYFNQAHVDRTLLAKLQQLSASYEEAVQQLAVDQDFVQAAQVRAEIGRQKYNNGLLNFEDWDTIESDLIVRQKNVLQGQRDRIVNEAAWEQALGKGVL